MASTALSVRLNDQDLATVCTVASTKKINKSKAIQHIIHTYAATQNNTPFERIQSQIVELIKIIETNSYRTNSNIQKSIIAGKEAKYISLYNFGHRADPEVAKNYHEAAKKKAREEK